MGVYIVKTYFLSPILVVNQEFMFML